MFNPEVVRNLKKALEDNPQIESFNGYNISRSDIKISEGIEHPQETIGYLYPYEQVFGTPHDRDCLKGISNSAISALKTELQTVENARVIGNSVVLTPENQIYFPNLLTSFNSINFETALKSNHLGFAFLQSSETGTTIYFGARKHGRRIAGTGLFLHNIEPGNYGSFMFRQLPQLIQVKRLGLDFDFYVSPDRTHWLERTIKLLGLPPRPVYVVREVSGDTIDRLQFFNRFDSEGFLAPWVRQGIDALIDGAQPRSTRQPASRKVFVSRALSTLQRPTYRPLVNESEVEAKFSEAGFDIIYPEIYTFDDQIRIFSQCSHIAGPSGSGMFNTAFAPDGAKILDIESYTTTVRQHAKLYSSCHHRYSFLFGNILDDGERPAVLRPWEVDSAHVEEALQWLTVDQ